MSLILPKGTASLVKPKIEIKFKKTHPDAVIPTQKIDDIGFDLTSVEDKILEPHKTTRVDTGLCLAESPAVRVFPKIEGRSGLACKGIFPVGGIVDRGFRSEITPILYNGTEEPFEIKKGDRIAQLVFYFTLSNVPDLDVVLVETDKVIESERGIKGFGSSGV